jgi:hypothetical protein
MTRVLLDEVLRNKLLDLRQPLELCDESGKVLARVTPVGQIAANAATEPQLSEEELQRREQEPDYSTAEVVAHLEKL